MTASVAIVSVLIAVVLGLLVGGAAVFALVAKPSQDAARQARADVQRAQDLQRAADAAHASQVSDARAAQARAEAQFAALKDARAEADSTFAQLAQRFVREAQEALLIVAGERFGAVASANAAATSSQLTEIVAGVTTRLEAVNAALTQVESGRASDREALGRYLGGLQEQTATLAAAVEANRSTTAKMAGLFTSSQARGTWGEFELKRILELAGLTAHVSYDTQKAGYGEDGRGRPDVVIYIPGGKTLPVDAKTPYAAYQTAVYCEDETQRGLYMKDAVDAVRSHIRALAARRYHATDGAIGFTVAFIPIEAMLTSVLAADPTIIDEALGLNVIVASPLTLLVLCHAFATGWAYASQQEHAQTILEHCRILVERLAPFVAHVARIGDRISGAADAYNSAVGSFELSIAPQARRIHELGGAEAIAELEPRQVETRSITTDRLPNGTRVSLFDQHEDKS